MESSVGAAVLAAMLDVVLVVDVHGVITSANPAAERVTRYRVTELRGMPIRDVLRDELHTQVRARIVAGDHLRREESSLVTREGKQIPVSVSASPVVGADGMMLGIALVARDVSELKAEVVQRRLAEERLRTALTTIESRLEETRSQLRLAERRATLGTLAGGVGHELRNIAQLHIAALETLRHELRAPTENARMALDDLQRVTEHITLHGKRLLDLARPGPDHVRPLNLHRVIRDVVAMLEGAGKLHGIEVVLVLDDSHPALVTVNQARIEQILVNLIVNAADAIDATSGKIMIAVHALDDRRRARVEVSDTGPGMRPEVLARIFEPFFTTKPDGTGLGLPVVREIVESYGGTLQASSSVGVGSEFVFDLPLTTAPR